MSQPPPTNPSSVPGLGEDRGHEVRLLNRGDAQAVGHLLHAEDGFFPSTEIAHLRAIRMFLTTTHG